MEREQMKLKPREEKVLNFMKDEIRHKGYPPTIREICVALGIKSTSTAHKDLEQLERKGYISKDPSKPRTMALTESAGWERRGGNGAEFHYRDKNKANRTEIVEIPVVGRIAAGTPVLAAENIEDSIPVPARFLPYGDNFMLTVRGDSMVGAGIHSGDYILVNQRSTASNGDIVVAMIDGFENEATVKTYYRENGKIRLQPENPAMSPIILSDVKILGLVKGVFRYL